MGTISIEQYATIGSEEKPGASVPKLDQDIIPFKDEDTTTAPKQIVLGKDKNIISVYAIEEHLISVAGDTKYATIRANERREFGIDGGETLTYRLA